MSGFRNNEDTSPDPQTIDPRLLQQEQHDVEATGSWAQTPAFSTATTVRSLTSLSRSTESDAKQPDLSSIVLNDDYDAIDFLCGPLDPALLPDYPQTLPQCNPAHGAVEASGQQYTSQQSVLRASAQEFVPQNIRPELHLNTTQQQQIGLHTPTSAPGITIHTPDGVQTPAVFPAVRHQRSQSRHEHGRPRRNTTGDPNVLPPGHAGRREASGSPMHRRNGFLSPSTPVDPQWLLGGAYNLGDRLAHHQPPPSSIAPLTPQSRHSRPASDTMSQTSSTNECETCGKRFRLRSELHHHARYHTPYHLRPCVCDLCGARFLFQNYLNRHMKKTNHSIPQLPCPDCGRLFGRDDHLERHRTTHTRASRSATPASSFSNSLATSTGSPVRLRPRLLASASDLGPIPPDWDLSSWPLPGKSDLEKPSPDGPLHLPLYSDDYIGSDVYGPPSPTPTSRYPTNYFAQQ